MGEYVDDGYSAKFLSTSSARRTTFSISPSFLAMVFLSTSSARRTTFVEKGNAGVILEFLSTSSARRTTVLRLAIVINSGISIHVLREEDDISGGDVVFFKTISIHVLREEDDVYLRAGRLLR